MVIYAGYNCKVFYKTEGTTYGDYADPGGGSTFYEIPFIETVSFPWNSTIDGHYTLGQRTLEMGTTSSKPIQKKDDGAVTIECAFDSAANSSWALAQYAKFSAGTATQFSIVLVVDTNLDQDFTTEAGNDYFICKGCYLNNLTVTASEGEYTKLSFEFIVREIVYSNASDGLGNASTYTDITTPQLAAYYSGQLAKTEGSGWDSDGSLTDGVVDQITTWSVTINNNFTKVWGLGSDIPFACEPGLCEITGSFTKAFTDMQEFAEIYDTETTGTLTLTINTGDTLTLTTTNYDSLGTTISEGELIYQEIAFTASNITLAT